MLVIVDNSMSVCVYTDDYTNSMQNPKLPDWAIVAVGPEAPATDEQPGHIEACGFFDEQWRLA